MRLHKEPFEKIKDDKKIIEIRLYDEKRSLIKIGDEIEFLKRPDFKEKIRVIVEDIFIYKNFSDLIDSLSALSLGYDDIEKSNIKNNIYKYYSVEDEKKYGVLGIKFKK